MKKLIALMAMSVATLVAGVPAIAQESPLQGPGQGSGTVPIVFQLTIHGQVPDGEAFYLFTSLNGEAPAGFFCTTMPSGIGPRCEDGHTYTATIPVSTSDPFSYSYSVAPQSGPIEHFETHTKVFTPGEIVTASYTVPSSDDPQGDPPGDPPSSAPASDPASSTPSSVAPVQPVSHTTPAADQYSSESSTPSTTSTGSSATASSPSDNGSGIGGLLPDTGGAMPLLIVGAGLLAGGGILLRRFAH